MFQRYKSVPLIMRIIVGIIIGAILGLTVPSWTFINLFGDLFVGAEGHCPTAGIYVDSVSNF